MSSDPSSTFASSTPLTSIKPLVLDIDLLSFVESPSISFHQCTLKQQHVLSVLSLLLMHTSHQEAPLRLRPYVPSWLDRPRLKQVFKVLPKLANFLPSPNESWLQSLGLLFDPPTPHYLLTTQSVNLEKSNTSTTVLRLLSDLNDLNAAMLTGLSAQQRLLVSSPFCVVAIEALMQNASFLKRPLDEVARQAALQRLFWYPFGLPSIDLLRFMFDVPPIANEVVLDETEQWIKAVFEKNKANKAPDAPDADFKPTATMETEDESPAYIITWANNEPDAVIPGFLAYKARFPKSVLRLLVWSDSNERTRHWADMLSVLEPEQLQHIGLVEVFSIEKRHRLHQLAIACIALQTNPHDALLEILLALEGDCPLITLNSPFHSEWVGDAGMAIPVGEPAYVFEALRQLLQEKPLLYQEIHQHAQRQGGCWQAQARVQHWLEELPKFLKA